MFEIYYGAMKSGKTKMLLDRIEQLKYTDHEILVVKPLVDTRDDVLKSRFSSQQFTCVRVDETNPCEILSYVRDETVLVAIDELQFFSSSIVSIIEELQRKNINIVGAGLGTNFRGETFGAMGDLLVLADEVFSLAGVCDVKGCNRPGTRTQRLIDGKPAPFDSPVVLIEGSGKETYETRCIHHHDVPGKKK